VNTWTNNREGGRKAKQSSELCYFIFQHRSASVASGETSFFSGHESVSVVSWCTEAPGDVSSLTREQD